VTPTHVTLVQISFRRIAPIADQAAALFFARLFELDPALRTLFRGNREGQGRKLISMLATAVDSLDRLETLIPAVRAFGARHRHFGAIEEHYATVGAALIWTLRKCLGPEFTTDVTDAWTEAYSLLAHALIDAQRGARVAVAA
jgi:hemoglobin-like flavoprotein